MFKRKQRLNGIQINIQIKKNLGMLGMNLLSLTGLLLVFMLAAGFKAVPVLAAEASIVASGECGDEGDNVTWKLDSEGTLTISGSGAIKGADSWYNADVPVKKVIIEDGVTEIKSWAFVADGEAVDEEASLSLVSVEMASTVTDIDSYAFEGCENLKEIVWSSDLQIIERYAFKGCKSLTEVILPDGFKELEMYAFCNCTGIKKVFIPSSATLIGESAFIGCSQLETLEIDSNNANYSADDRVLYNKDKTELIFCCASKSGEFIVPESVSQICDSAFEGCTKLTNVTLSEKIREISDYAFSECTGLTTMILPSSVECIGDSAFSDCSNLSEIVLSSALEEIYADAFYHCNALKCITIPKNVTYISEDAFAAANNLEAIVVDADNQSYASQDGILYNKDQTEIIVCPAKVTGEIVIPETVTSIGYAFTGCEKITKITIPEGVTELEWAAFQDCISLEEITLPKGLKSIGEQAFENCEKLKEITIPEGITQLGQDVFCGCSSLEEIILPEGLKSIGGGAFWGCKKLTEIALPENLEELSYGALSATGLTSISIPEKITYLDDDMFQFCENLETVELPSALTGIGSNAFSDCSSLKEIKIPDNVTEIGDEAFTGCTALEKIELPEGLTAIGEMLFYECTDLQEVILPNSLKTIGYCAFESSGIVKIQIPENVTEIGLWAFECCENLTELVMQGDAPVVKSEDFGSYISSDLVIYYPKDAAGYDTAPWTDYLLLPVDASGNIAGTAGENISWALDKEGTLTLSGTGAISDYQFMGEKTLSPWYQTREKIKKVVIGDGITRIGERAFCDCENLEEISFSDTVSEIGYMAFSDCYKLKTMELPSNLKVLESDAFWACRSLEKVAIPSGISVIEDHVFYDCSSLKEVKFLGNIKTIGTGAFEACGCLTEIEFPSSLVCINNWAFECTSLTTINIPENVTTIGVCAFSGCPLKSIQVDINNKTYCSTDGVIYSKDKTELILCSAAKTGTFTVPESVTTIAWGAFCLCEQLTEIMLPSKLTEIENHAFSCCYALENIVIPSDVTMIGDYAFYGCTALETVTMSSGIKTLGVSVFDTCRSLKQLRMQSDAPEVAALTGLDDIFVAYTLGEYIPSTLVISYPQGASGYDTAPWTDYTLETYQTEAAQTDISTVQMPTIADQTYAGSACKPAVKISGLVEGTDFTVAYSNNTKPGTATITVTGIGAYKGTAKIQFNIKLAKVSLSSVSNASGGVLLKWKAVSGAAGYQIYRKESGSSSYTKVSTVTSGSTLTYTDKTASQGKTYTYKVRAYYGSVMGDYSAEKTIKRLAQPSISVSNGAKGVTVKWNKVTGASGYNVYRKVSGASTYTKIKTISSGSTVSYTDTGAAAGKTYLYKINAYSGNYVSGFSAEKTLKRLAQPSISVSNGAKGVTVKWNKVTGASGYNVYRKVSGASTYTKIKTISSGSTVSYTDTGAAAGKTYLYKINAYSGNYVSCFSAEKTLKRLAQPSVSVSNGTKGVTVKWNKVAGASGYNVYRKVSGASTYTKIKTISSGSTVSCTDTGAAAGKTYSYKINAYSGSSVSIDSAVKTVKRLTQPVITVKNDSKGVTVSWKKITGASGYYVYRKASGESSYKKVKTITSGSTLSYTNTGLTNGKNYSYKVTAYSDSGKYTSAGSSAKAYYRLDTPSISSLKNSSSKKMTVKWGKNTKAAGFEIQYGLKSSFSGASKVTVKSGSTVSKTISGLTKGKTYYVRIRSYKTVSGKKYYSAWSSVKSVKISK